MKSRYLVTGGNGFIGGHIVKSLVNHEQTVTSFDLPKYDVTNYKDFDIFFAKIDKVIHLAYINGTEKFYSMPEEVLRVAVSGISNVLAFCERNNIAELVIASSSEVYQTPTIIPTPEDVPLVVPNLMEPRYSYGGGKIITELMAINWARKHHTKVKIFRPHNVYGPGMTRMHVIGSFITRMLEEHKNGVIENFYIIGTGEETRSFVYIDDLVMGVNDIINYGSSMNVYNIGTQREIRIIDLVNIIASQLDIRIKNIVPSVGHSGSTNRRCPDISKIQKIGYNPQVSLEDGIAQTIKWFRLKFAEEGRNI